MFIDHQQVYAEVLSWGVPTLIASKTGVDGNTLATTNLTNITGLTPATTLATFAVIKYATGTYTLGVIRVKSNATTVLSGLIALSGLASGKPVTATIPVATGLLNDGTGSYSVEVTTINGSGATFDIYLFGIKLP